MVYASTSIKFSFKEENKSNIDSIIFELNDSIETDIKNAILQDMSKKYKSNINQNFLNSF